MYDNIAFPLHAQKMPKDEVQRARDGGVASCCRSSTCCDRQPRALSGGDQQRVALARALVRRPAAFLMDEPLGALDAEFRAVMRAEIKRLHLAQNATTVYVTHDQIEAMAMGDRIVVMSNAVVQQVGTPAAGLLRPGQPLCGPLYRQPRHEPDHGRVRGRRQVTVPGGDAVSMCRTRGAPCWSASLTLARSRVGLPARSRHRRGGRTR